MLLLMVMVKRKRIKPTSAAINAEIKKAARGKLADFKLAGLILHVWRLNNRRLKRTGNEQVDAEEQLEWAHRPYYERALGERLVEAIVRSDTATLRDAAKVLNQIYSNPRETESHARKRVHYFVGLYFRSHKVRKLAGLRDFVSQRMNWGINSRDSREQKSRDADLWAKYNKQIERALNDFEWKLDPSKPGPGPTS